MEVGSARRRVDDGRKIQGLAAVLLVEVECHRSFLCERLDRLHERGGPLRARGVVQLPCSAACRQALQHRVDWCHSDPASDQHATTGRGIGSEIVPGSRHFQGAPDAQLLVEIGRAAAARWISRHADGVAVHFTGGIAQRIAAADAPGRRTSMCAPASTGGSVSCGATSSKDRTPSASNRMASTCIRRDRMVMGISPGTIARLEKAPPLARAGPTKLRRARSFRARAASSCLPAGRTHRADQVAHRCPWR